MQLYAHHGYDQRLRNLASSLRIDSHDDETSWYFWMFRQEQSLNGTQLAGFGPSKLITSPLHHTTRIINDGTHWHAIENVASPTSKSACAETLGAQRIYSHFVSSVMPNCPIEIFWVCQWSDWGHGGVSIVRFFWGHASGEGTKLFP